MTANANGNTPHLDWTGLLAWSANYHDGTNEDKSRFKAMSKEDREYLQKAMEQAFSHIEDMNAVLQEGIKKLQEATSDGERVVALEVVSGCYSLFK